MSRRYIIADQWIEVRVALLLETEEADHDLVTERVKHAVEDGTGVIVLGNQQPPRIINVDAID